MKHLQIAFGVALLALVARADAQEQPEPGHYEISAQPDAAAIDSTTQATDLNLTADRHLRMTVPVRLVGTGPYRFLIDTGSDHTVVSRDLAERLRLQDSGLANVHSVTGVTLVGTATVPHLDFTAEQLTNVEAALLDARHMGADGILGLDTLRSHRILFDFKDHTLTVVPSERRVRDEEGAIVIVGKRRNGRLILTKARAENMRVTAVIDTGSEVTIGNEALRDKLARANLLTPGKTAELISVTGQTLRGESTLVKKLEIGGVVLGDVEVVFAGSHAFGQLGLDEKPALLLGMNALRAFDKVSIDFARKKLRVVLPEKGSLDNVAMAAREQDPRLAGEFKLH